MNLTRTSSVITDNFTKLEELSSIEKFPVFIGATNDDEEKDQYQDLTFDICTETGMIQLRNLVDPEIVYSQFHSEAIGKVWETHHDKLLELILKYQDNNTILEIGGSDSRLAIKALKNIPIGSHPYYVENSSIKKWIIVEPNLKLKHDNPKLKYIEKFFDSNIDEDFDMVVHSHTLEHMYMPEMFLNDISYLLKDGDFHIFSVPNLLKYLENKYINTINFEHTLFLTEHFIDFMLSCYNFEIIEKQYYEDHSIFYVTKKSKTKPITLHNKYKEYKQLYLDSINYYKDFVNDLNKVLKKHHETVYLFGGHVFSQYLITLGLDTSTITCILDNSKSKINKRLYGTDLLIESPENMDLTDSLIILKVGQYQEEIKKQLLEINPTISFYE
jgi:hypothetical protein